MTVVSVVSAVSDLALRSRSLTRARFAIHGSLTSLTWLQCGITDFTDTTDRKPAPRGSGSQLLDGSSQAVQHSGHSRARRVHPGRNFQTVNDG